MTTVSQPMGLGLHAAGFVVAAVTWAGIRTVDNPAAQLPVIVSGGLTAIGLFGSGSSALQLAEVPGMEQLLRPT